MRSSCCLCVCVSLQSTFECLNQSLLNLACMSWHLSPFQRRTSEISPINLCAYMCNPLPLLGNGWAKFYRGHKYTRNNKRIVGRVVFYAVRVV
jgi:hypothetical protein